jgi:hypothetical protein
VPTANRRYDALCALPLVAAQVLSFPLIVSDSVALGRVSTVAAVARLSGLVAGRALVADGAHLSVAVLGCALAWLLLMSTLLAFLARCALEGRPLPRLQLKVCPF